MSGLFLSRSGEMQGYESALPARRQCIVPAASPALYIYTARDNLLRYLTIDLDSIHGENPHHGATSER
jgi:hypothetical protein